MTLHLEQAQTASLDLIGQLEKGKEERRKAWEKEEKATRKTEVSRILTWVRRYVANLS